MRHPIQPLELDTQGVLRFKQNAIVHYLLDAGPFDMNQLAMLEFSREDREQFAQLIGYSLSGFGELSYASDEVYEAAQIAHEQGKSESEAIAMALAERLRTVRAQLREGIAILYGMLIRLTPTATTPI